MKPLILIFLFLATLSSYSADDEDTYKVLNDIFVDLVDTGYYQECISDYDSIDITVDMFKDSSRYIELVNRTKVIRRFCDSLGVKSTLCILFVQDTFANYKDFYTTNKNLLQKWYEENLRANNEEQVDKIKEEIKKIEKPDIYVQKTFHALETDYQKMIIKLINHEHDSDSVDIDIIYNTGIYKIYKQHDWKKMPFGVRSDAFLSISKVVFNEEKTLASMYFSNPHQGDLILLKQVKGKWEITDRFMLWIE